MASSTRFYGEKDGRAEQIKSKCRAIPDRAGACRKVRSHRVAQAPHRGRDRLAQRAQVPFVMAGGEKLSERELLQ